MKTSVFLLVLLVGAPVLAVPVSVSIVDAKGAPVAGADVQWQSFSDTPTEALVQHTGADGRATFEVAPPKSEVYGDFVGRLAVFKSGFAIGSGSLNLKKPSQVTLVSAGAPITGTVVDAQKKPLAGAKVSLSYWTENGAYVPLAVVSDGPLRSHWQTVTNAAGHWSLDALPPDIWASVSITAPGFATARAEVGSGGAVQTALHAGARLDGRLLGLDGKPLPKVRVYAQPTNDNVGLNSYAEDVTALDGTFKLDGLEAGVYNVMFQTDDDAPYVVAAFEGVRASVGTPLQLDDARAVEGVQIGGKVSERGSGKGIAGIQIGIYGGANPVSSAAVSTATTDANGVWKKRTLPGSSRVYVMGVSQEFVRDLREKNIVIGKDGQSGLDFQLSPATKIRGRLLDENGQGVQTSSLVFRQKEDEYAISSDKNGDFQAFGPADGEVEVGRPQWFGRAKKEAEQEWDVVGAKTFPVASGKPIEIHLKRAEVSSLELGVFDQNDEAIEGAKVTVYLATGSGERQTMQPRELRSDKTGRAHLEGIRADETVSIHSVAKDGYDAAPLPKLEKLNGVYRADLTLAKRNGTAKGEVFGIAGKIAAGASVFGSGVETTADEAGRFSLSPIPSGKTEVFAYKDDGFALGYSDGARLDLKPQTLEETDTDLAQQIIVALKEQTKNTKYWNRDSLSVEAAIANFDAGAAKARTGNFEGVFRLIGRFANDPSVSTEKWVAFIQSVKSPSDRLYAAAFWAYRTPVLSDNAATEGLFDSLQNDVATVEKPENANNKFQNAGGIFGAAALAERLGKTDAADALFERGNAYVQKNFPEKGTSDNPSQDDTFGVFGSFGAVSPRFFNKMLALVDNDSSAYTRILHDGAPVLAHLNGLDAAQPFLDKLKNAPTPKVDPNDNNTQGQWQVGEAILKSIKAGGKSNPQLALELAQSLPKSTDAGYNDWRTKAICEAAFFQPPSQAATLWRASLPSLEASEAMKYIIRIADSDEPLARGLYETVRAQLDAQPDTDQSAMIYGRDRQTAAFAFYEARFAPARARYRLEKAYQKARKDPNARYDLSQYPKAMAVFDANRALVWADQLGNEQTDNFAGFEAKRAIAHYLAQDETARRKEGFGPRYGGEEDDF